MMGVSGGFMFATDDAHRPNPFDLYSLFRRPFDSPDGHLALKGIRRPDDGLYAKPVEVAVAGKVVSARLENNAFAALADAQADDLEGVTFHRTDGSSVRV